MSTTLSDNINDFCFIDTETKALPWTAGTPDESVVTAGAYRYARCSKPIMIQFAIGDAPVRTVAFKDFDPTRRFVWAYGFLPDELIRFWERAKAGKAWFVAWNAAFDRLQLANIPHCVMRPEMVIDAMAQAVASNLPAKLEGASRSIGREGKQQDGKALINMFTGADWTTNTPQTRPEEWARFCSYGGQDIDELRAVYKATRPLPRREWEEYWASERINDRGTAVDVEFCDRAAALAEFNERVVNASLRGLTGGAITTVGQTARIGDWLYDRLPSVEARDLLVKEAGNEDEITGEDDEVVATKLSIAADRLEALVVWFEKRDEALGLTDEEYDLLQLVEARLYGASATPKKFQKIVDQHDDGRLKGQYTFNGAQQTGRFSSRGVQVHNLVRASLTTKATPGRELDAIDMINELELAYE